MGVTQTAQKKRPLAVADLDAVTVSARREKNRQAQHVFRRRKQATEAAQVRRIRRLEEVVEEMSCVIMRVFDAVLETEMLTTGHPSLVTCLDGALARVLELAKEVVDSDGDPQAAAAPDSGDVPGLIMPRSSASSSSSSGKHDDEEDSLVPGIMGNGQPMQPMYTSSSSSSQQATSFLPEFLPQIVLDDQDFLFAPLQPELTLEQPIPLPPHNWKATQALIPPQVFGTSWSSRKEPGPMDGIILPPTTVEFQARLRDLGSFTQRLTESIISHGYAALVNSTSMPSAVAAAEVDRAFGYTLRYRTREQISDTLQWFLGPGREYMYRASGFTWGGQGGTKAEFPPVFGVKPKMGDLLPEDRVLEGQMDAEPDFLTALGVHEELRKLGAELVDTDIIEIRISNPAVAKGAGLGAGAGNAKSPKPCTGMRAWVEESPAEQSSPASPSGGNMFGFMLKHRGEQQLTLRLNMTLLIMNLMRRSVCFVRGPAFPRHELGEVVQSSVVSAEWS